MSVTHKMATATSAARALARCIAAAVGRRAPLNGWWWCSSDGTGWPDAPRAAPLVETAAHKVSNSPRCVLLVCVRHAAAVGMEGAKGLVPGAWGLGGGGTMQAGKRVRDAVGQRATTPGWLALEALADAGPMNGCSRL